MRRDLVSSAILLCIAAAYYAVSTTIPSSTLEDGVGPRGLPVVLAALLAMAAIAIGVRALVVAPVIREAERDPQAPWPRALGMLLIGVLYIPVANLLGYWATLLLLILAVTVYEGMKPSWRVVAVAIGGASFFFLLFDIVLGVRVPQGLFF
jgi:putative tricarboxylic transport membrane protein